MNKKSNLVKSLDDVSRLAGGYVKQSLPVENSDRDRVISEALSKRKATRLEKV
ncbi:hypothetical protein DFQ01_12267 [Paenibacillus cellulosilyticus]|uniref:Uncharacterized protein n=1 Tax=Paenibacillus cellulosilyticus TaxID=375489 RepID=A0A2V2YNJ4_9BACL|nr:hypothetical protein [Paenibacillus cellulosilyticus]PWV97336.1 hypothetical protein DFQ01_12267 [Paenibacillus cellulosilyticus]QKS47464.1 hypothetical protein HUB94_24060 [Paenibacillus cellulosilyticus]